MKMQLRAGFVRWTLALAGLTGASALAIPSEALERGDRAADRDGAVVATEAQRSEWTVVPFDANGSRSVRADRELYLDVGDERRARRSRAENDDPSVEPCSWRRSPTAERYVDLGRWPDRD